MKEFYLGMADILEASVRHGVEAEADWHLVDLRQHLRMEDGHSAHVADIAHLQGRGRGAGVTVAYQVHLEEPADRHAL